MVVLNKKENYRKIRGRVEKVLSKSYAEIKGLTGEFVDYLRRSSGKRLRAVLLYTTGKILGADEEDLFKLGAAIELVHSASLFHDDIIDEANERRGITAAHRVFGIEEAIILGDLLYIKSIGIATKFNNVELIDSIAKGVAGMIAGEMDESLNLFRYDLSEEDYFRIIKGKTASLFSLSCYLPSVLLRETKLREILKNYGNLFGTAFQILDDIADIVMEEKKLGKPVLSDLREGKLTLPYIYYIENGGKFSPEIKDFFEKKGKMDFYKLKKELIMSGSINRALLKMEEILSEARATIKESIPSSVWKDTLFEATELRRIYGI